MVQVSRSSAPRSKLFSLDAAIFWITSIAAVFALCLLLLASRDDDNSDTHNNANNHGRDLSKKDQVASLVMHNAADVGSSKSLFVRSSSKNLCQDDPNSAPRDFKEEGRRAGTSKVMGNFQLEKCMAHREKCSRKEAEREKCRTWDFFYDTMYNHWLQEDYSKDNTEAFQFLEIGFYHGQGMQAFTEFLPNAEIHSIEIACIEEGPREEGKWPWGNFAKESHLYDELIKSKRLHCGDATDFDFLHKTWKQQMKRSDAPPLKVVVDDGSHVAEHMAASLFFWIPRIEPGGMLIIEGLRPDGQSDRFRSHILPQVMKDLHWCGDPSAKTGDTRCFPTIQPFIAGVHCEMHICTFLRNDKPSEDPSKEFSVIPTRAFKDASKCLFGE